MKIALDVMGGDFAPKINLDGAAAAVRELPDDCQICLIGREDSILPFLEAQNSHQHRFEFVKAEQVIEMGENPTKALAQKPDSSIGIGFQLLKEGEASVFCSAGNTGAMHVGAMLTIKPIKGVLRPAILGFSPKLHGGFGLILDIGANADCKPEILVQFGELGSIYCEHVLGIENPKVGLMNMGEEEKKGPINLQAAYQLFKLAKHLNFVGNLEGRDILNEKADVIVCDGFTGNVILKLAESFYDMLKARGLTDSFIEGFNHEAIGGSPILGLNGNVIICHGSSSSLAIKNSLLMAQQMAQSNIHERIRDVFAR